MSEEYRITERGDSKFVIETLAKDYNEVWNWEECILMTCAHKRFDSLEAAAEALDNELDIIEDKIRATAILKKELAELERAQSIIISTHPFIRTKRAIINE